MEDVSCVQIHAPYILLTGEVLVYKEIVSADANAHLGVPLAGLLCVHVLHSQLRRLILSREGKLQSLLEHIIW